MVHLDGRVERLVDNNEDAQVDPWEVTNGAAGYNSVSRHIVYVGGCDKAGKPKDTRTEAQRETLKRYVQDFHRRFPQIRIVGHHELNPGKACPSFDVPAWLHEIGIRQI
jgi:N-acetyl-anhydromuramyl-L-alanine amidase AmpD